MYNQEILTSLLKFELRSIRTPIPRVFSTLNQSPKGNPVALKLEPPASPADSDIPQQCHSPGLERQGFLSQLLVQTDSLWQEERGMPIP
mmetsp:Transcript_6528/g.10349  ORF Transcript_6528/g.10349 Transcript_6528/m.10349 type:complete len:89 (+) Transcript_6528:28-294(+)